MKTLLRRLGWVALGIAILALAVYIWIGFVVYTSFGPRDPPEGVVTPDAIGIIEDIEASEDGTTKTLLLDSGEEVVVHNTRDIEITGDANEGYLLVTGEIGEARWNMFVRSGSETGTLPESCYVAGSQPFNDGNFVIFPATAPTGAFGIRLPKAEGFEAEDPNPQTLRWGNFDGAFCLNEQGEVTGQADLLRRESE